jgi:hypothetical protein
MGAGMDRVKPLKRAGAVVVAALLTMLAVDAYNAFSGAMQASLLEDMRAGIAVTDAEIVANDDRVAMAATV